MKALTTLLICLTTLAAIRVEAKDAPEPQPANSQQIIAATGAFFALSVPDLEASRKWYSEKLGLKVILHPPRFETGEVMVLGGGGLMVELIQSSEARALNKLTPPVDDPFKLHGYFKAGVVVDDLDATVAILRERSVTIVHGPYRAKDGIPAYFIISDNAGNLIQFLGPA